LQDTHDPEIGVFLNLGLSAGHDVALICKLDLRLETLPQCESTFMCAFNRGVGVQLPSEVEIVYRKKIVCSMPNKKKTHWV
jgi:hypothetical protein